MKSLGTRFSPVSCYFLPLWTSWKSPLVGLQGDTRLTCGTMLRMAAVESLPSGLSEPAVCLFPPRVATCSCSHTNVTRNRKTAVRRQEAVRRRPMAGVAIATRSPRPAATRHMYGVVEVQLHTLLIQAQDGGKSRASRLGRF